MRKILFIDIVHPILAERLSKRDFDCIDATKMSREEIDRLIPDAFGIIIRARFTMDENFLKLAKNLKFIARSGSGLENIDQVYCNNRNIKLFNSPEGNRNAVAEHALGMLLNLLNKLNQANYQVKNGIWDREGNRGEELDGKTIGIIGYGNNGAAFTKKLRGFDVKVMAYDKFKSGFIPVSWNPTYHLGIMYATWAAKQDSKTKHEYERLQNMLMQLRDKQDETSDPATKSRLDHQISYHSDRVNKMQVEIAKMEGRYGV